MQVWIASYPRSGNTFLRLLLRHRYALLSICSEFKRTGPPPRTWGKTTVLAPDYESPSEPVVPDVLGVKTHGFPDNQSDPAVYIIRDGRDSLVSYAYFSITTERKCQPEEVSLADVRDRIRVFILNPRPRYGTWSQNVDSWLARPNTMVVRYENLIVRPAEVADGIISELGIRAPVVAETIPEFEVLKASSKHFFRRGQAGAWSEVFTAELHELFWVHNGRTMDRLGYRRQSSRAA